MLLDITVKLKCWETPGCALHLIHICTWMNILTYYLVYNKCAHSTKHFSCQV